MAGFLVTNFWIAMFLHLADTLMLGSLVAICFLALKLHLLKGDGCLNPLLIT